MLLVLFLIVILVAGCSQQPEAPSLDVSSVLGGTAEAGFARAMNKRPFDFPRDHGAHPEYRNEWWYVTGNLTTDDGRRFGYQVTFFRIALAPATRARESQWATRQLWLAHVALSDIDNSKHLQEERLVRGAAGLAGAAADPFAVWVESWRLSGGPQAEFPWRVEVDAPQFGFELQLEPLKPLVLQGEEGLSRKGAEPGNASYYYSYTRLRTKGRIRVADRWLSVAGRSWLDREWSTSALTGDQAGWDWFSIQLDDGRELMYYQIRRKDGRPDRFSAGKLIGSTGVARTLNFGEVRLEKEREWVSGEGERYPVQWTMEIPHAGLSLRIRAAFDDQQMKTSIRYWEGAVEVFDKTGKNRLGVGYLEMTGY